MNKNDFIIIIVGLLIAGFFFYLGSKSSITGNVVADSQQKACPYECCDVGSYLSKSCNRDYECLNNKCILIDSDKDGLSDIEERQIGTNPQVSDTDSDGLNDYIEVKQKMTDPTDPNTDKDRYKDGEDKDPIKANSANIVITKDNLKSDYNYINLALITAALIGASLDGGISLATVTGLNPNMEIIKQSVDYTVKNTGDDYTSYANFDAIVYICKDLENKGGVVKQQDFSVQRLNPGESKKVTYEHTVTVKEMTGNLIASFSNGMRNYCNFPENIRYENFN